MWHRTPSDTADRAERLIVASFNDVIEIFLGIRVCLKLRNPRLGLIAGSGGGGTYSPHEILHASENTPTQTNKFIAYCYAIYTAAVLTRKHEVFYIYMCHTSTKDIIHFCRHA